MNQDSCWLFCKVMTMIRPNYFAGKNEIGCEREIDGFMCRETLTSTCLIDYTREKNILVWGGNVKETESHEGKKNKKRERDKRQLIKV